MPLRRSRFSGRKKPRKAFVAKGKRRFASKSKRKFGKKRSTASKAIIKQPSGIPDRLFVKLKWNVLYSFNSISGALVEAVIRGNSPFDPDTALSTTSAYFFSQWATFYTQYICHGSKITIIPYTQENAPTYNFTTCLVPAVSSTLFGASGQELMMEQPYRKMSVFGGNYLMSGMKSHYMSSRKIYGGNKIFEEGSQQFRSNVTTNPINTWYWHIGVWSADRATSAGALMDINVEYYVEFFNRARPATST